jgi:hypothetical protein
MTPLDIALNYIERRWNPVPVPFKSKAPIGDGWQTRICEKTNAAQLFNGSPMNVGVLLGVTSHGLTDVDLDCPEAVAIAPYVLPPTDAIFGRPTKRSSHWLYETDLSVESDQAAVQFRAPDGKMLVELRIGGGGKGAQTVFPGSVHESGELINWESDRAGKPATADGKDLARRVRTLAAACLVARAWPAKGGRHNAALVVGGVLGRVGMTEGVAGYLVEAIAKAGGSDAWKAHGKTARDALRNYQNGGNTAGLPKLRELVGEPAARKIADWLDYRHLESPEPAPAAAAPAAGGNGVALEHFYSYMPMHRYMFTPAREMWPGSSVDARIPPVPLFDKAGLPVLNKKDEQVLQAATAWLDQNRPVEQMTWAPGLPMIIPDRLISEGGWIPHKGVNCFNLYRPPFAISGKAAGVDLWINHVRKIYPGEADHIIKFLAHRVQRPAEKINHALVLGGPQGIGKDTLLEPVKRAVGPCRCLADSTAS